MEQFSFQPSSAEEEVFDAETPPVDDPEKLLAFLIWYHSRERAAALPEGSDTIDPFDYDKITPEMMPKAIAFANHTGMKIQDLSPAQILLSNDPEMAEPADATESPDPEIAQEEGQ